MKKIAVFGKPANGKSTLSNALATETGIKLYALDSILYKANGQEIDKEDYEETHANILLGEQWIIEGFAPLSSLDSFYQRLDAADTLIYIELPYWLTYWLVAKRFFIGVFRKPEGWPKGSSILKGTLESYRVLKLCPKFWNANFLQSLEKISEGKDLYIIRSIAELNSFIKNHVK